MVQSDTEEFSSRWGRWPVSGTPEQPGAWWKSFVAAYLF